MMKSSSLKSPFCDNASFKSFSGQKLNKNIDQFLYDNWPRFPQT